MKRFLLISCLVSLGSLAGRPAHAQCEAWSPDFGHPGFDAPIRALVTHDDGSGPALYVAGAFRRGPGGAIVAGVAKRSGSSWIQVGTPPVVPALGKCGLTVADVGNGPELYVHGSFLTAPQYTVAVHRWNGTQWTQVGPALFPPSSNSAPSVDALVAFDDGTGTKLYAGGSFPGGVARFDGTSWSTYAGGLHSEGAGWGLPARVNGLAVHDDGSGAKLYAVGRFDRCCSTTSTNVLSPNVARVENGAWASVGAGFGESTNYEARGLASFPTPLGRRLAVTGVLPYTLGSVATWDGASWTSIYSVSSGTEAAPNVCGFEAGSGVAAGLWISGEFTHVAGMPAPGRARFDGSAWTALGATTLGVGRAYFAAFDDGTGTSAYAAPTIAIVEKLGANSWSAIDPIGLGCPNGQVQDLAVAPGPDGAPNLYVHGMLAFAAGVAADCVRFDGDAWHAVERPAGSQNRPTYAGIDLGAGPKLYAIGAFSGYGPATTRLLRRDGATWTALPNIPTSGAPQDIFRLVAFDDGTGTKLHAAANLGLWRFDGANWSLVFASNEPGIRDMLVHDDGSGPALFVAGFFTSLGGQPFGRIARWDGHTLDALQGGVADPTLTYPAAYSLAEYDFGAGPELVVGGSFTTAGSVTARSLARWTGSAWLQVGGGVESVVEQVLSLDLGNGSGNSLFVRGYILRVGGVDIPEIARWDGANWHALDGGVGGNVLSFAEFDAGNGRGPELFVGGYFETAGGASSLNLARLENCGGDANTFCHGDGSATACPCGNESPAGARVGCLHSLGTGAALRVHGRASLADDTLRLEGAAMPNSSALYFQGANVVAGGLGVPFGDGLKCTAGPLIRLGAKSNVGGASAFPSGADLPISVRGAITSSGTRHYQVRYRNSAPFCTADTFNYTNGVSVIWGN